MREIKFRAWDKETECYLYNIQDAYDTLSGHVKYDNGENAEYDEDCFGDFLNNKRYDVEQFTGLHDKDGRKIYEGDLFEHRFGYMVFDDVIHDEMGIEYGVVVLEDGQFGVKIPALGVYNLYGLLLRDGHLDNMPKGDLFVMKIAGNIHDIPELLEAEHD